ncbi:hypothetical protein Bpfe_017315 [Biomphalaria pfeifferi]|uniref:Uncharacterized protein n=1 Tax=Biomphalaria pfeifferi TaxID=112525 RepID=A0AAD8BEM2_BIOPF|nr:hypothetical protein Bpfe_017315 [Biomphalaria pfeifferi]
MLLVTLQPYVQVVTCIAGQKSVALEIRGHVASDVAVALQPYVHVVTCIAGQRPVALEIRGHVASVMEGQGP